MSKEKKNNLTIKIFSLIIAIILWSYVMSEVNPRITKEFRNIDIVFSNMEDLERSGIELISPKEAKINVKVTGRRSEVLKLRDNDIIAKVDLSGYSEGTKKVPIYLDVPSKVEVVDYSPREISFKFEKIVSREKTVIVKTVGKLESGYSLGEAKIRPQSVILKGPKSWINLVSEVVAVVDVTGRTNNIKITVPIKLLDDDGNYVRRVDKEPNVIDIFIPMYKCKKIPIDIQLDRNIPKDYENFNLNVSPNSVNIRGDDSILNKLSSIKTKSISVSELIKKGKVQTGLVLPEGIEFVNSNQKIFVTLKSGEIKNNIDNKEDLNKDEYISKSFEYDLYDLSIKDLGDGLGIDGNESTDSIVISLNGPKEILNSIKKENLSLEIDLKGLDEGVHEVELNVKNIEGISITEIVPAKFRVSLKKE